MLCGAAASWRLCKADSMLKAECGRSDVTISILLSNIAPMLQYPTYSLCTTIVGHSLHVTISWYGCTSFLTFCKILPIFVWPKTKALMLLCFWQHHANIILVVLGVYSFDAFLFWPFLHSCCILVFTWTNLVLTIVWGHVQVVCSIRMAEVWWHHGDCKGMATWGCQHGDGSVEME